MLRLRLAAMALALGATALLASARAEAAGFKEAQAKKALREALEQDYLETRFDAAERKLRAALKGCARACSATLRAKLHVALAEVLAGGKRELEDARDEFVEALTLDPKAEPNPDLASTEVKFAYVEAKKKLGLATAAPSAAPSPPPEAPKKPEPPPPSPAGASDAADANAEPGAGPDAVRKNWISLSYSADFAIVSGSNVCTVDSQNGDHYVCVRADGSRYDGHPTVNNADNLNAGIAPATMRVLLGYDRVVHPNLSVGLRVGFAWNGASASGATFLPLHLEGRFGIWPGHDPFAHTGVRPFFMIAGGIGQVDARAKVQVLEDGAACGAANPSDTNSPCSLPRGMPEARQQTLTVYRQEGLGFATGAFGVQFVPSTRVGLHLAVRGGVTFPSVAPIFSPEAGIAVGF